MDEPQPSFEQVCGAIFGDATPPPSPDTITAASELLDQRPDLMSQLHSQAFPNGVPIDKNFYDQLGLVFRRLGFKTVASQLIGRIWAYTLLRMNPDSRESLLRQFLSEGLHQFFPLSGALPIVIERVPLSPDFALQFLKDIGCRVSNDMIQGGYWRSLEAWARSHPPDALRGLTLLVDSELDDKGISMGATILGNLRVAWEIAPLIGGPELEESLRSHSDVSRRLVYHRSWINTGLARGLSDQQFGAALNAMATGGTQEQAEAFNFLRCLLPEKRTQQTSLDSGIQWLTEKTSSQLPDTPKYCVVNIVFNLAKCPIDQAFFRRSILPLLGAVQPISIDQKNTWDEIEQLLVHLLVSDFNSFEYALRVLLETNPAGIHEQFRAFAKFEYLLSQLAESRHRDFFARTLFSLDPNVRKLAFILFDELPFPSFPDGLLEQVSDDEIALALSEFQLHYLESQDTIQFLEALLARVDRGSDQIKQFFYGELLHQAKNFPGAVLGRLKAIANPPEGVRSVVEAGEAYFDGLRKAHKSVINSIEAPGWRRAVSMRSRRQSREIQASSEKFSVLAGLVTKSYIIYGTEGFRTSVDGSLDAITPMKTFSTQMEVPRMPGLDPEGEFKRQINAGRLCQEITAVIRANQDRQA